MKTKRSKACDIPKQVKDIVWERDDHKCILCGNYCAMPNAHYIPREKGGLGIEQNIVTLCMQCHYNYDQTTKRPIYKEAIKKYLQTHYDNWNEENLVYRR